MEMSRFFIICKVTINNMDDVNKVNTFIVDIYDILSGYTQSNNIIIVINIKSSDYLSEYRSYIKSMYNKMYVQCSNVYDDSRDMKSIFESTVGTYMLSSNELVTYFDLDSSSDLHNIRSTMHNRLTRVRYVDYDMI